MKKSAMLIGFLCAGNLLFAQFIVTGKITDSNGNPVSGASVSEKGTGRGAVTDENGVYRINMKNTNGTLVVSGTGLEKKELTVSGATADIQMAASSNILESVSVVGSRSLNRSALTTAVPVDVIPVQKVINQVGQLDINQMLQFVAPSFNANRQTGSDGADHVDPATLRGLGPDQTLVLINGKRYHQSSLVNLFGTRGRGNTGTDLNTIPVTAIERIEILRDGAAAQYGSDAIAGVINIVLKSTTNQLNAALGGGITGEGDGLNGMAGVNYGIKAGSKGGYVNLTGEYNYRDRTNRSDYAREPFNKNVPRRFFGDAQTQNAAAMLNANIPINANAAFYAFGGYNFRHGDAYAWSRSAGDLERNIRSIYPEGFDPHITSFIHDVTGSAGFKGTIKDWNWDINTTYGLNKFQYEINKTLNASIGPNSPTSFYAGGFSLGQSVTGLHITKMFKNWLPEGTNLAFGTEFRQERYKIFEGEEASWKNYGAFQFDENGGEVYGAGGSQGFPGFQPKDATSQSRNNIGVYADGEMNFSKAFMLGAAARYEHYSDFGSTINGKLSARYTFAPQFTLRGSVSTGFRAPSLAQVYFSSTYTNFEGGVPIEIQLAPNNSELAKLIGIPQLKQEKSVNASLGFTSRPVKGLTVTIDGYLVNIMDRIVLTGDFDGDNTPEIKPILDPLNIGKAKFFTNAVDTKTLGLDAVISYTHQYGMHALTGTIAANFNKLTFGDISTSGLLAGKADIYFSTREQSFVKASAPPYKINYTIIDKINKLSLMLRFMQFAKVELENYNGDIDVYKPKVTTDLSATYEVNRKIQWTLGASNLFNVYPTRSMDINNTESGGQFDPVQMGINGSFFFTKLYFRL